VNILTATDGLIDQTSFSEPIIPGLDDPETVELKTYTITLVSYVPYTTVVTVDATDVDAAIDFAMNELEIPTENWSTNSEPGDYEIEVDELEGPDLDDDEEEEDDEL